LAQVFFGNYTKSRVFKALEWLSAISVATIMDKKNKLVKISAPINRYLFWNTPLFYMANNRQQIELESCSNPL